MDFLFGHLPCGEPSRDELQREIAHRETPRTVLVRPVVASPAARAYTDGPGVAVGNTVWADSGDHTVTYGKSALGWFEWGINLFPIFDFGNISTSYTPGSYGQTLTVELLDKNGSVIKSASANISTTITIPGDGTYTLSLNSLNETYGNRKITAFNAVR